MTRYDVKRWAKRHQTDHIYGVWGDKWRVDTKLDFLARAVLGVGGFSADLF